MHPRWLPKIPLAWIKPEVELPATMRIARHLGVPTRAKTLIAPELRRPMRRYALWILPLQFIARRRTRSAHLVRHRPPTPRGPFDNPGYRVPPWHAQPNQIRSRPYVPTSQPHKLVRPCHAPKNALPPPRWTDPPPSRRQKV